MVRPRGALVDGAISNHARAYVIVVHRAMDVRVVIRQGLQYALATGGIRVLQVLLTIVVVFSVVIFARTRQLSLPNEITTISAGVWLLSGFVKALSARAGGQIAVFSVTLIRRSKSLKRSAKRCAASSKSGRCSNASPAKYPSRSTSRASRCFEEGGCYRPAFAIGFSGALDTDLAATGGTVQRLKREANPERVYFDDEKSWVNSGELNDEERQKLVALEPQLLLPLAVKDKLLGIICLGQKRSEAPYSGTDVRLLKSVATQTALALSNAELTAAISDDDAKN